ncbi:MAG: YbaK/EbsC family protein [Atribacterota bacterium]|nr:YbaK/EbsC family protein [Atribacterota bacterium]MDD4895613.1 YbaK/EbsC family protein [Atribacterota bacterium]MDD5637269.1 YbaK/EbsC family protein [Atribacterota bacterium]
MNQYEKKLQKFIKDNHIQCEYLQFDQSCHSVLEAARAANVDPDDCVKNICLIDAEDHLIVAIVKGDDRVSTSRVGRALNIERPRTATPDEILKKTGYPCGGTPSFGYQAEFLVDPAVMEKNIILTGGGSEYSLIKISPKELQKKNNGKVVKIRK